MVRAFTDHVRLAAVPGPDRPNARQHHRPAGERVRGPHPPASIWLRPKRDSLNAQISGASTNVGPLQSQVTAAEAQAEEIERRRAAYEELVSAQGVASPRQRRRVLEPARGSAASRPPACAVKVERDREASTDAEYAQKAARIARDHAAKELKRVEHVGSALPEFAVTMRDHICTAVGARLGRRRPTSPSCSTCSPEQTRWRAAVEKVLRRGRAAAAGARPALRQGAAVRQRDQHARRAAAAPRARQVPRRRTAEPEPNTLAGKLFVVNPDHPCAAEARRRHQPPPATTSASTPPIVFARFRRAVTDTGLYKDSDRLAIKDDRRAVKPSEYIYQGDITAKLDALTAELAEAEQAFQKARQAADDIAAQRQQWRDRAAACKAICEQFPQWSQIDTETAEGHADRLREQYELLMADNPDIEALSARAEECWIDIQTLMTRRGAIQTRRDDLDGRRTRLMDLAGAAGAGVVIRRRPPNCCAATRPRSPVALELLEPRAAPRARCSPRSDASGISSPRAGAAPTTSWPASSHTFDTIVPRRHPQ